MDTRTELAFRFYLAMTRGQNGGIKEMMWENTARDAARAAVILTEELEKNGTRGSGGRVAPPGELNATMQAFFETSAKKEALEAAEKRGAEKERARLLGLLCNTSDFPMCIAVWNTGEGTVGYNLTPEGFEKRLAEWEKKQ